MHRDMNTSDELAKSMSSANLGSLLNGHSFRICPEIQKAEIRKRLPAQEKSRVERIWTKSFDDRRAREEVRNGKQL